MQITVTVSEEFGAQAEARGLRPEEYAEQILAREAVPLRSKGKHFQSREEVRAWLDSLGQFSDEIPELPATITREWIYQDHD